MPTYTPRGFPLYTGSETIPGLRNALNSQSNLLDTAMDEQEAALLERDGVDTVAELPLTGNQLGRLIYVFEDDRVRRWNGSQWGVIGFPPAIQTSPSTGSGWTDVSINRIHQRSGWVQMYFNARRSSAASIGQVVIQVPAGYRGDYNAYGIATHLDATFVIATPNTIMCWYNRDDETIELYQPVPSGNAIALSMMWPLEGST